jgi:hypothetical protein
VELKSKVILGSIFAVVGLMLVSGSGVQQAFAHASTTVTVDDGPADGSVIRVVLGHTSEPTFGALPGIHDGKHNLEVFLTDAETRLPLTEASLEVDKFYFESLSKFKAAKGPNSADEVQNRVPVEAVFGDPGHYVHRQVQKDGIYGYRIYGTIDYFGEGSTKIDKTIFCVTESGGTNKFNKGSWSGGFGCTEEIEDILFPEDNEAIEEAGLDIPSQGTFQQASLGTAAGQSNTGSILAQEFTMSLLQMLVVGAVATIGSVFGFKAFRKRSSNEE